MTFDDYNNIGLLILILALGAGVLLGVALTVLVIIFGSKE